jgi:hypothetical protein
MNMVTGFDGEEIMTNPTRNGSHAAPRDRHLPDPPLLSGSVSPLALSLPPSGSPRSL